MLFDKEEKDDLSEDEYLSTDYDRKDTETFFSELKGENSLDYVEDDKKKAINDSDESVKAKRRLTIFILCSG